MSFQWWAARLRGCAVRCARLAGCPHASPLTKASPEGTGLHRFAPTASPGPAAPPCAACRWALALQVFVLSATLLAWATSYIHSYKASLWGLASVVTFICILSCNNIYMMWPFSEVCGRGHVGPGAAATPPRHA